MVVEPFQDVLALPKAHGVGLHLLFLQIFWHNGKDRHEIKAAPISLARYEDETTTVDINIYYEKPILSLSHFVLLKYHKASPLISHEISRV